MNVIEFFCMYWDFWLLIGFFVATAMALDREDDFNIFDMIIWVTLVFVWPIPLIMKYFED